MKIVQSGHHGNHNILQLANYCCIEILNLSGLREDAMQYVEKLIISLVYS